jgi:hypothetical protein
MSAVDNGVCHHCLIHGSSKQCYVGFFQPSRGLRQGDPLSPYLFLFVADGLSRILQHEVNRGALYELKICRNAPSISHLLFADDTLMFLEATDE